MRTTALLLLCLASTFISDCRAQSTSAAASKSIKGSAPGGLVTDDQYKNEALIWQKLDTTIRVHADGTGEKIMHVVVKLQSEGAAREFSVLSVSYAAAYETGTIDYVRVHKPDGSTVETPTADSIEMPAAVTREAPLYSDLKEKQLPVRSIASGDVLDYQFTTVRTKAEAPGQSWGAEHFMVEAGVMLSQTLTLEVPADKYLQIWSPNHPAKPVEHKGLLTYTWTSSQLKPSGKPKEKSGDESADEKVKDPDEDADGRKLPSVAWTTFHSWVEVGEWYRSLALDRAKPTPAIEARATALTKDAKTPEDQVRALYDFVSMKIRYVGIDFGVGHYQPHTADEVMDHEYGDCKDKDTLLESLLRAKGFSTAPALIGVNIAPVADLPSPALFNHVITTVNLPTGRIWLDTTPEVEPFRELIPQIRDEQALVVPGEGPATLQRTPADPPFAFFERYEAKGTLDKDGLLKAHMEMTLRSDNEMGFRILLQRAAPSQWDQAMQSVAGAMGFGGTVTNANLKQGDPAEPVHISYDYTKPDFADWAHRRILPLFPYLDVATIDKDKAPDHDIDQGSPRTIEAITQIQLPDGYHSDLPDAVHVKRDYATFDKTYRLEKNELTVERKVVVLKKKVPKADWKDYYAYTKAIGLEDGETYIAVWFSAATTTTVASGKKEAPKSEAAPVAAPGKLADADVAELMKQAYSSMVQGDRNGEKEKLEQIKNVRPDYPYLWSMLGSLAATERKPDEAIADLKTELKNHPDTDSSIPLLLAGVYTQQKRNDDAIDLLKNYSNRGDLRISYTLANLQTQKGDDAAALETLKAASTAHPDDRIVKAQISASLHRLHRDPEAAASAKEAMDGSDDPNVLNDAAFELAETRIDLPLAEKNSRRSVELEESKSAEITLQEANTVAFQKTENMIAAWDTLGWILFLEKKPEQAQPYLAAAWFHRPDLVVGDHLAQVKEALSKPSEALTIDELALASGSNANGGNPDAKQARQEVKDNAERLRKAGAHSSAANAVKTLQDMRTFHLAKPKGLNGSATFRVQLAGDGVKDSELVSGDDNMRSCMVELNKLKIPHAVPAGSPAHVLRDGVLNCSSLFPTCEFVLLPRSGLAMEAMK
jgi:tetratricopeptide (TPR) repeat protein